jgi:hypothetical protein
MSNVLRIHFNNEAGKQKNLSLLTFQRFFQDPQNVDGFITIWETYFWIRLGLNLDQNRTRSLPQ